MSLRIAGVRTCQRVQRGGDHQFQIALGENHIGVLPIKHFSLLGNADLPSKSAHRLGIDGTVRGTAAAAYRAAAAVKQPTAPRFHLHLMQSAVSAENLPRAGEHPAVFVGVGISQHDLLRSPGL